MCNRVLAWLLGVGAGGKNAGGGVENGRVRLAGPPQRAVSVLVDGRVEVLDILAHLRVEHTKRGRHVDKTAG